MENTKKNRKDELSDFLEALKKGLINTSSLTLNIKIEVTDSEGKVFNLNKIFEESMIKVIVDELSDQTEFELQTLGE